ncbi:MAG: uroporphyrinogen decarboxylase family protein [Clostridia bacterium]|nr:uroporphyrinogen decarboxylase family protein [Clostridia bacterium]
MKINMREWLNDLPKSKKAFPILSFPCVSLLGCTVKELISDSDRQAEGMVQVAKRTDSAAAIGFMDLSVEAECFGASIRISDDEVPTVTGRLIEDEEAANALSVPSVGSARTGLYIEAIRKAVPQITDRPVFAGMIGPFSLAARLLDVSEIMMDCYDEPEKVHTVLEKVTEFLINYARAFRDAGANGIMIAEPVAGLLSPALEAEFSAPYVKKIVDAVQDDFYPVIYHNCGDNVLRMIDSISSIGAAGYHFGNSIDLKEMLEKFPQDLPVMGNVDPAGILRMSNPETVREKTLELLENCSAYANFIPSSGCDVPPMTPWNNLDAFFGAVKEYYGK